MFRLAQLCYQLIFIVTVVYCSYPQVRINYGTLRGQYLSTDKGRLFSSFTAIPYAKPPVGELRFQRSQPIESWQGILDATQAHPVCPQVNTNNSISGDEDCLYLNVYTPQLSQPFKRFLPVMIFIHGFSFLSEDANRNTYDPSYLLDQDIVLVVPNYRLGPLGFLSYGDEVLPGNNGLKDQNLAIIWTVENIIYFGGNSNEITLFGQSAGGASSHFHMLSSLSKDLIHGVISESGHAFSNWALALPGEGPARSKELSTYFSCPIQTSYEMVKCLQKVDARELTRAQNLFYEWDVHPLIPFKPVIEPNVHGAFLNEDPADIIKSGRAANVPFLLGFNSEDGAFGSSVINGRPNLLNDINNNFKQIAPIALLYRDTAFNKDYVTKRLRKFYFKNGEINNFTRSQLTAMFTDGVCLAPTVEIILLHLKYTQKPVYFYIFAYRGAASFTTSFDPNYNYGVAHGDELLYLFKLKNYFPDYVPSETDKNVANVLTTLWASFASTGNPNPIYDPLHLEKWHPVQSKHLEFYLIRNDKDIQLDSKPYWERNKFWVYLITNVKRFFDKLLYYI